MPKFSKIFVPSIIGVLTYIIANKLVRKNLPPKNPSTDLRGGNGDTVEIVTKTIFEKFTENGPLKLALISVFVTAMYYNFDDEIQKLLAADVFKLLSKKETKGNLKIVCYIVKEYNLDIHSPTMSELIVASHLSNPSKINLLKIKLDYLINGEFSGKKHFILKTVLSIILVITISGSGILSISLFLEALYKLFKEGRISEALYKQIVQALKEHYKNNKKIPIVLENFN